MQAEHYQRIFELMLAIQGHRRKPFPQHLVDMLDQFFPGYTIVLFTGPSHELFIENREKRTRSMASLFYQPAFTNTEGYLPLDQYWSDYYQDDPGQPVNLPENLRGKTVVCYSDTVEPTAMESGKFNCFLSSHGVTNKATIYLYEEDICLAGIAMCRRGDIGPFTQDEQDMFQLIGKAVAPHYLAYLRESFLASIADIYRTYYEPGDIGLALVTARAELIEANKPVQVFCRQIADGLLSQTRGSASAASSPLAQVVRMLIRTHAPVTSSIERTVVVGNDRFHCLLKPCMLTGLSTDIHTLYVLRISKETDAGASMPASMVKQYQLTNREKEIVDLLISGFGTEQISKTLYISRNTVKNHVSNIFRKMEVGSRIELLGKINQ